MKRRMVRMALLAGVIALSGQNVRADDDKPLAPGVLSLDSSVGVADQGIANGKGSLEKASRHRYQRIYRHGLHLELESSR